MHVHICHSTMTLYCEWYVEPVTVYLLGASNWFSLANKLIPNNVLMFSKISLATRFNFHKIMKYQNIYKYYPEPKYRTTS